MNTIPVELTETGIRFHGIAGLILFVAALVAVLYLFRGFMFLMAGKRHRNDWVIKFLFLGGALGIILSAFGIVGR